MKLKKVTACEDNFWERDLHYAIKNNRIHNYFHKMKKKIISVIGS